MLTIKDRLRSKNIKRWHTVSTSVSQNVAEHSHNAGIIAEAALELVCKEVSLEDRYHVLKYMQIHDLSEICLSDVSSVFKVFLNKESLDFKSICDSLERKLVPEFFYFDKVFSEQPHLKIICKLSDLLEAFSFISFSKGLDVQHNTIIFNKLNSLISDLINKAKKEFPAFSWDEINNLKYDIIDGDSVLLEFERNLAL